MKDKDHRLADASELRRQAEDIARGKPPLSQEDRAVLSPAEMSQALEELRVHQIELELQNEELRCRQVELDALRERYFDLYDLAPIGYLVVSQQGLILEANLTAATLLGVARSDLVQQPLFSFILRKDEPSYHRHRKLLLETGTPQVWEMRMLKQRAAVFWVQVQATVTQDAGGEPVCRMAISDITERKTAEQFRLVADSAYDWEYWLLPDGSLPYVSPSCVEITGYRVEEFQQDPRLLIHIVHPDDRHRVARQAALAAGGDCQKWTSASSPAAAKSAGSPTPADPSGVTTGSLWAAALATVTSPIANGWRRR